METTTSQQSSSLAKWQEYATAIFEQLKPLFNPDHPLYFLKDFEANGENVPHFIHAIGTVVPANICKLILTGGEEDDFLDFNYTCNRIIQQFTKMDAEPAPPVSRIIDPGTSRIIMP